MRAFNIAGPCRPDRHYMIPPERRLPGCAALVDKRAYFVVHAPRQTGKTTTMKALARHLTEEGRYAGLHFSCEAMELKVWRDRDKKRDPLAQGLSQLDDYLGRLGLDEGVLVIFDCRSVAQPIEDRTQFEETRTPQGGG